MTTAAMVHIPLAQSFLCQDCASVGNSSTQCPACASGNLLSLINVLDRDPEQKSLTLGRRHVGERG